MFKCFYIETEGGRYRVHVFPIELFENRRLSGII